MNNALYKYDCNSVKYNIHIINDFLYNEKKHIVANFKENVLWNEPTEFLGKYFKFN